MDLKLTKKQTRVLLKLVYLGGALALPRGGKGLKGAHEIYQYLFSRAGEAGLGQMLEQQGNNYDLSLDEAIKLEDYINNCMLALRGEGD